MTVTSSCQTGGLLGTASGSSGVISNCYATGSVTGDNTTYGDVGGLVGSLSSYVLNSYSTGLVTSVNPTNIGGLIGKNTYTNNVHNCLWDTQTSGQSASNGGTGKTTAEMKSQSTFTDEGWDFTSPIWAIAGGTNNGYPNLLSDVFPPFWVGISSTSWNSVNNWDRRSVPIASENVILPKTSRYYTAFGTGATCNNLTIPSGAVLTPTAGITVNGTLTVNNDLNLNGQTITLGSSATLVEGTGIITGTSGTITTTRDLSGITAQNVAGLGATITTAANMGSTVITRGVAAQTGNGNQGVKRYFDITPTTNTGLNATFVFNYDDSELNSLTESTLVLFRSTNTGSTWFNQGGTVNTTNNTVTLTGIDAFSRWTAGSTAATLAVPLPPTVTTTAMSAITSTTASSGGNVTADGGASVTARGVCWNTTGTPTISDSKTTDGTGTGVFTSSLTGLTDGTTYYVRAYATNSAGTSYGSELSFVAQTPLNTALHFQGIQSSYTTTMGGQLIYTTPMVPFSTTFTVMGWVYGTTNSVIFSWGVASYNKCIKIDIYGYKLRIYGNGTNISSTTSMADGWHHIAVTSNAGSVTLYVDGVAETTGTVSTPSPAPFTTTMGTSYNNRYEGKFEGLIDELSVWSIALTDAQILAYKNTPPVGTETGALAVYDFHPTGITPSGNNTGYTTLSDLTGNYPGTLFGFPLTGEVGNWVEVPVAVAPAGSGTSGDPYLIATKYNLYWLTQNSASWGSYFQQTANIDATGTATWNGFYGLTCIGTATTNFTGTYDGNGKTISNLNNAVSHGYGNFGFFGRTNGATIKNLGLLNAELLAGNSNDGILAGAALSSVFSNCYTTGSIDGHQSVGGLIGFSGGNSVTACYSSATVSGTNTIGGLLGYSHGGSSWGNAAVANCYATGNVSSDWNPTPPTTPNQYLGGLIGLNLGSATVLNSYSSTVVNYTGGHASPVTIGGLTGSGSSYIYNSFWDTQTSGQSTSPGGTGKTTAEMKTQSTFTDGGWDFTSPIWAIAGGTNNGYPNLLSNVFPHFWTGRNSSDWSTASNWDGSSLPTASDNVILPTSSKSNTAFGTGATCNNITIPNGLVLTPTAGLTVNGTLTVENDLNLNGQTITLGSTATLVEGSGIIYGTSGTITTTRDLSGITAQNVAGLGATITTAANMGSTVISRGHAAQTGNGNEGIKRYYDITPTTNTGLDATLVFNYADSELNSLTESTLVLFRSTNTGSTWFDQGGTVNTTNNTLTLTGIDAFSRWTGGSTASSLEVSSPPTVTTNPVIISITPTSASSGGNVTADGGQAVTARGVCWNTTGAPTIADSKTTDGTGTGAFTSSITGLTDLTTYYVRAYATNSIGTSYGSEVSFTAQTPFNTALNFDGVTGQMVDISPMIPYTSSYTVMGWVNITANNSKIFSWGSPVVDGYVNIESNNVGKLRYYVGSGGAVVTSTTTIVNAGWLHITVTRNAGLITVYINGVSEASATESKVLSPTTSSMGSALLNGTIQGSCNGAIDELSLWDVSLTSTEINNYLATSPTCGETGIVALYDFNNTYITPAGDNTAVPQATTLADESGNAYTGTLSSFSLNGTTGNWVEGNNAVEPTVTTTAITSITQTSAASGGNVTDDGGEPVTASGVCWNTTGTPTTSDSFTTDGTGTGTFTSSLTGLSLNTIYHVRAYATNVVGTSYGNELSFTTLDCINPTSGGAIAADQASCSGFDPATITSTSLPTGHTGTLEYKWQESTTSSSTGFSDISSSNSPTYDPPTITVTTWYKRLARVDCKSDWTGATESNVVQMLVYPTFVVGSISTDQTLCYNTAPAELTGVAPTGGNTPYIYQWQNSTDGTTFADISGATGLNYTPAALSATTYYQLVQTSASTCGVETTNMVTITVYPDFVAGSISADQSICYNTTPAEIVGVAPTGGNTPYTYQWQNSTDGTTFADISGATGLNYSPAALSATTYYQLVQTSASTCGVETTNMVTITVYPDFVAGSISADQSICYNTTPAEIVGVAPTGGNTPYTYQWQNSTDGTTFADISGATGLNYTPAALSATTYYQLVQTSASTCGVETTNMVTITVYPDFVAGSISADQSICYNTTPAEIVGVAPTGGNTPYTYQWQNSTDGTTFADISGATGLNYSPAALSATTYYQLVQTSASSCGVETTNMVTITVYPDFVVGSISADQTICFNTAPAELTGVAPTGGNTPYIYQWQNSTDGTTFADISGATGLNYSPAALSATTYYQLVQTSASTCGVETTNMVTITVYPDFVAGSISADQSICYNTTPAEIVGVAPTGGNTPYTYQWQNSTDGTTFADISGATGLNYSPAALSATTYYQLVQTSASSCGVETTNMVTITVYPDFVVGLISADQTICYNTAPAELTGVAPPGGNTPYTYQWQNSTDGTTFADISGATSLNYTPAALSATTYYQLVQTSASGCGYATTNMVTITVYPDFVVGSISADQTICFNTAPAELTGVAPTGGNTPYIYQWQNSTDGTTFADISGATGLNYSPAALSATTYYQLVQTSASSCGVETTNMVTITVYPDFVVGLISADQTICYNTAPAELTGVAPTGGNTPYTYQWQNSTDGTTFADITGATSLNYQPGALFVTTYYQLIQTSASGCGTLTTNMVTITGDIIPPIITSSPTDQSVDANENCEAILADYTGDVVATDNCDTDLTIAQSPIAGTIISGTANTVTMTVTDDAGNFAEVSFNVEVVDNTDPTITSPGTQIIHATADCDAVLPDYTGDVVVSDNCDTDPTVTQSPVAGTIISGATNPVTLTVADYAGNSAQVTFNVKVLDITPPDVTSPHPHQFVDADESCQAVLADYTGDVVATDNCSSVITIVQSPAPGTIISGPTNEVQIFVSDETGNTAIIQFNVAVVDNTDPTIVCVEDQNVGADETNTYTVAGTLFDPISTDDNCEVATVENDYNNSATLDGAIFPLGTTTVTWTVEDNSGNTADCSFDVTVYTTVGLESLDENSVSIYPNPTTGKVYFEFTSSKDRQLKISDFTGRPIFETNIIGNNGIVDLSTYARGVYIITILEDNSTFTTRILKR